MAVAELERLLEGMHLRAGCEARAQMRLAGEVARGVGAVRQQKSTEECIMPAEDAAFSARRSEPVQARAVVGGAADDGSDGVGDAVGGPFALVVGAGSVRGSLGLVLAAGVDAGSVVVGVDRANGDRTGGDNTSGDSAGGEADLRSATGMSTHAATPAAAVAARASMRRRARTRRCSSDAASSVSTEPP